MSFEITDHVPGLTDAEGADMVEQAEAGYDLADRPTEPHPRVQLVPDDPLGAIDERTRKDGRSPEAVLREALSTYLDTA